VPAHSFILAEVTRAAATLELRELIERVSCCLDQHRAWDLTSLSLYDADAGVLRNHSMFRGQRLVVAVSEDWAEATPISIEGTQSGVAFASGQPCTIQSLDDYRRIASPVWVEAMMRILPPKYSSCAVPLVNRGRRLGTLGVGCAREHAFDGDGVALLEQIADAIAPAVDNVLVHREMEALRERLLKEKAYLEEEISTDLGEIVGDSAPVRELLEMVTSVAGTSTTVLIHGETGTGKELVARAVHRLSPRRDHPFVKLNCAAIPTGLLESELFGHERGAFTGAIGRRAGRFELAHQGTLFLDEIGDIPLDLQPKLLRVLQDREFERLGGERTLKVDARLVTATNRNLREMVAQGSFRSDLYYRLNVFSIEVPALRERREDIARLVHHFVARAARRLGKIVEQVPREVMDALVRYDWPGNVRELESLVERAVILARTPVLYLAPAELAALASRSPANEPPAPAATAARSTLAQAERRLILKTLEDTGWVVGGRGGAAARLGLSRTTLQARMRKHRITRPAR
jgi:formate hydrogenlyase transcriptional activator